MRGLFLNTEPAICSIHESGKMIYAALTKSKCHRIDYLEMSWGKNKIPGGYDFYIYNYHYATTAWIKASQLKSLPGTKICVVLEVSPNDPFVLTPKDIFDAYMVIDPTIKREGNVYPFPRPLEHQDIKPYISKAFPVIGSFGLLGSGKGFPEIVEAVGKEFDHAVIRFNFAPATHALYDVDAVLSECRKKLKPGIELNITNNFMSKKELIAWLSKNTLNVFLYTRDMPGLAATTDQAIASGRPLAISRNDTFRHILPYVTPYPERSLKESIRVSTKEIYRMQTDWSMKAFALTFDKMIKSIAVFKTPKEDIVIPRRNFMVQYFATTIFPTIVRVKKAAERRAFGKEIITIGKH